MIKLDDYDDAIIGPAMIWGDEGKLRDVLVYDGEAIRQMLMTRDGMSFEDAREFIEFNIEGAYMGPHTPIIVWPEDQWPEE
jgi:hypothetical protein